MRKQHCLLLLIGMLTYFTHGVNAQCSINISNERPCSSETITFEVIQPEPNSSYSWDLDGDGSPEREGNFFSYEFPESFADSTYQVVLYQDGDSCQTGSVSVLGIPDVGIGVAPGIIVFDGNELKACNGSGTIDLQIFNTSITAEENLTYTIDWGDDSPPETFDNNTFSSVQTVTHTFNRLGYFTIRVSVERSNGCVFTENYVFYNGGNPSVGLVNPGNTVGLCAPATLDFPITNTENNPPGTIYTILVNGMVVDTFSQENVPSVYSYTFETNSCGVETTNGSYVNAFDMRIVASNPCNSSAATVEPIEVSARPEPEIAVTAPLNLCAGESYTFEDLTQGIVEVISGNPSSCLDVLSPSWTISGTVNEDWVVESGSLFGGTEVGVSFLNPGVYTVELTIVSFSCGPLSVSREITIFAPPELITTEGEIPITDANSENGFCAPIRVEMPEIAKGDSLTYEWTIEPATGWEYLDSTHTNSAQPIIQFNEGGTFAISATVNNPCSSTTWNGNVRIPGPPTAVLSPLPDFCEQGTLSFDSTNIVYVNNDTPITGVAWSFPGAQTTTDSSFYPQNIVYDSPGTYEIALQITNGCGERTILDTLVVQMPTTLQLPNDTTVCDNSGQMRLRAQPTGGTWSGPGIVRTHFFDPSEAFPGQNTITYTFGVGACFTQSTFRINVLRAPEVEAGSPLEFCPDDGPRTFAGNPTGGTWFLNEEEIGNTLRFDPAVMTVGQYDYLYEVTADNGCIASDTLPLRLLRAPVVAVADTSYCNTPGQVPLPIANMAGTWSGPGTVNGQDLFDPIAAGGAGLYQLQYEVIGQNGCRTVTDVEVGVIDPTAVDAGRDLSICANEPPIMLNETATPPGGRWFVNGERLRGQIFDPATYGPGSHTLEYYVGQGNCRVVDQKVFEVIALPIVDAGVDQEMCIDENPIDLIPISGEAGIWSGHGLVNGTNTFDPQRADIGTHTLYYSVADGSSNCSSIDSMQITVHPKPIADFSLPEIACIGTRVPLESNNTDVQYANWSLSTGIEKTGISAQFLVQDTGQIDVTLTVESIVGCQQTSSQSILAMAPPEAIMDIPIKEACLELELNPVNRSNGARTTFAWDFGNGSSSTDMEPTLPIIYEGGINDTSYVISLVVENACGQSVAQDSLWVLATPVVDFGFSFDTACAPVQVFFNNVTQGNPQSFAWDFGNGERSMDSLPGPQQYWEDTMAVDYPITLVATNQCGLDSMTKYLTIAPQTITSFFNVSRTKGCAPLTISLEDFSSPGTRAYWNFGDGQSAAVRNPEHTFHDAGRYLVKLYTTSACTMDSSEVWIEVDEAPKIDFDYSTNQCIGEEISFTNQSEEQVTAEWIFNGQDTLLGESPTYRFQQVGTFPIQLNIESLVNGCPNQLTKNIAIGQPPAITYSMDNPTGCTPLEVSFSTNHGPGTFLQWEFGDGNGSVSENPVHIYQDSGRYEVSLTIMDTLGCASDTLIAGIHAYPVPSSAFELGDTLHCGIPAAIELVNRSIGADAYQWDLGDSQQSNFTNPLHTYERADRYSIQLVASNRYGCTDQATRNIRMVEQPVADVDLGNYSGCAPYTVTFSSGAQGETFYWDLGDGTQATDRLPIHTYETAGYYDVSLIVGNEDLCFDTLFLESAVQVNPSPMASFVWADEINGEPTGRVLFENTSTLDATQFYWDFGDGYTSKDENPIHRFLDPDIKEVYFEVTAENGCPHDTTLFLPPNYVGKLYVPNAVMPDMVNGEAKLFLPKGYGLKEYRLQIYSTYGELLWESFELIDGQPAEGWDGTFNGTPLPQDVYVWKIQAVFEDGRIWRGNKSVSGKFQKMGSVTLLR